MRFWHLLANLRHTQERTTILYRIGVMLAVLLALLLSFSSLFLWAHESTDYDSVKSISAIRASIAPKIDVILDDDVWIQDQHD
jgi:hypothetical protein